MRNPKKPVFYFGLISTAILFIALALKGQEYKYANYILYGGFVLGAIFWLWSIVNVSANNDLKRFQKSFWLIIVISVPMLGGLVYYILHQDKNNIAA